MKNIQFALSNSLLPPVCILCGAVGLVSRHRSRDLCLPCLHSLPWIGPHCVRCALPLTVTAVEALCGRCQTQPPAFEACLSPFHYRAPLDHLLLGLKFNGRLAQARLLGDLMTQWLASVVEVPPEQIIPVPLHVTRLRERGFNQAVELARSVARYFDLPLNLHGVRRIRATPPQSDLSRKERLKNIQGVFEVMQPMSGSVVIIDDVMTTGSTAHELAAALLNAGAEQVEVWVCARA
ncbi:MAG: ComF family protein [Gammaproteobacteria bacterium]|nr:ComF family protein [Gammaproteobacteria bacterium]